MAFYINKEHLLKEIDYPARYQPENLLKSAVIIFAVVFLFLLSFKPFGVYSPELKINYFFICCLHALTPAAIILVYFGMYNRFIKKSGSVKSWTLLKEYIHIGIIFFLTGIISFLIRDLIYNKTDNWSWYYLWEEISNCFIAGIIFYFFLRLASFYFQSKEGSPFVIQFVPLSFKPEKNIKIPTLFIHTQVKQDDFNLDLDNLLFVKADGNYIELTKFSNNQLSTELKRISLTQFELQISAHTHFFRCHRAYLVNMYKVEKITGNSQGYLLSFPETLAKIPVSRKQLESFNSCYEQLKHRYSA